MQASTKYKLASLRAVGDVRFWGQSGHDHWHMSAFVVAIGGKADIAFCGANVCF